jgi:transcriptional regulator with XRE-family HTH domain
MQSILRNFAAEIGRTIRVRRKLLRLLQPGLARLSGISIRTIQLIEQGKGNPGIETIIRVADPLGLKIGLTIKKIEY